MALNQLGLGLIFTAQNLASTAITKLAADFSKMDSTVTGGSVRITGALKQVGLGLGAVAAGAIALAGLNAAGKRFEAFEEILAKTQVTGQLTAEQMVGLEDVVVDLSRTFGTELQATATGLFGIVSAGLNDAGEAAQFFGAAQKLAIAGSAGLEESVRALIGLTIGYGKNVTEAAKASDVLALAAARSQADVSSFAAALPQVIPLAAALKVPIEELVGGLAAITETTATASEASTQLASIFSAVLRGTKQSQEAAKELGIEFTLTALKTKGLAKFLEEIGQATAGSEEKLTKLFGRVEAVRGALSLGGAQANTFKRFVKDLGNAAGTTDRAFATMAQTSKFLTNQLSVASDVIVTELIGKAIIPMFNRIKKLRLAFLNFIISIPRPLTNLIVKMVSLGATILLVAGAIAAFQGALVFLAPVIAAVTGALVLMAKVFLPITLGILAIVAVVKTLQKAFEINLFGVRKFVEDIATGFKALSGFFAKGEISGNLAREFLKMGPGMQNFVVQMFRLGSRIQAFFEGLTTGFREFLSLFGIDVVNTGNFLDDLIGTIAALIQLILDKLPGGIEAFREFGRSLSAPEGIKAAIAFVDKVSGLGPVLDKMITLSNSPVVNKLAGSGLFDTFSGVAQLAGAPLGFGFGSRPENFGIQTKGGRPPLQGSSPGLAAASAGADQAQSTAEAIDDLTVQTTVVLDGQVVAETVNKVNERNGVANGQNPRR